jgi:cation:H+ antiporter
MAGITGLTIALLLDQQLGRVEGALLMAGLVAYVVVAVRGGAVDPGEALPDEPGSLGRDLLFTALGIAGLALGARAVVEGAVVIAARAGVPEGVIGTTVVAFGTSLPELAATVRAAIARKSDIAVGNIVGSNVFNLLSVLGACAVVTPVFTPDAMMRHVWIMGAVTALLLVYALARPVIGRWIGVGFLAAYLVYVILAYRP